MESLATITTQLQQPTIIMVKTCCCGGLKFLFCIIQLFLPAVQLSQNRRLHEMARGNYELSAKSVGRSSIVQSTPEEIMNQDNTGKGPFIDH